MACKKTNTITIENLVADLVDPEIIGKIARGYFERPHEIPANQIDGKTLAIACVDSRLPPGLVLGHSHGEAYTVQTVANVVPKINHDTALDGQHLEVAAALEYAIKYKGVNEVFVLGHTHCGGAEARITQPLGLPCVNSWMSNVGIPDLCDCDGNAISEGLNNTFLRRAALRQAERECLSSSIEGIKNLPFIEEALGNGGLSLAGLICDLDKRRLDIGYSNISAHRAFSDLVERFREFREDAWGPNGKMTEMVRDGQHPQALIVTGISPYVAPEKVFGIKPGDAFIHRRIGGNYHHDRTPGGLSATIEFAVSAKKVRTLVFIGHRNDVNRDYADKKMLPYDLVTKFMEGATPELREMRDRGMHPDRMHDNSLRSTYFNALRHPSVRDAVSRQSLSVIALMVDNNTGTMEYYEPRKDRFLRVMPN